MLVAGSTSGDGSVSDANGRSDVRLAPAQEALADAQTLADRDLSLAEGDQTGSDSDQTLSDVDQTSADSDQTSADRDQVAADHDQAASDQDLAAGGDRAGHDVSQAIRERSADQRAQTSGLRDRSAQERLRAAEQRDAIADARDVAALARDQMAVARDVAIAQAADEVGERPDDGVGARTGTDAVVRARGQRRRAAQQRAGAAEHRVRAAEDRLLAQRDRDAAARERRRSLIDREMLVAELQREQALREEAMQHQHRAEKLARTLQRSLSPPSLPSIAGLDVAVHHEPSAPEEVGGDFYDLFPLAAARTGFFLGDVCGKGPEAAAVTSLARYTMRTAAMLHETPEAILMDLNAALLMNTTETMQMCTAVYGQIAMSTEAVVVTLAVAGHPPPLIVRADGSLEVTSAHGTALGAVADPVFETCQVTLGHDDTIVMYSDGILDVQLDGARIDDRRVAELLSGVSQASAEGLVEGLVGALRHVQRPLRDDVAIMALRRTRPHEAQVLAARRRARSVRRTGHR